MLHFLLRRVRSVLLTFFGVSVLSFALPRLVPGHPCVAIYGPRGNDVLYQQCVERLGLDRPLIEQFLLYLASLVRGDLGDSIALNRAVADELLVRVPATVELAGVAMFVAVAVGLPAGVMAAWRRNSLLDHLIMGTALAGYSMPLYWWGLLILVLFVGVLPQGGAISTSYDIEPVTGFMLVDSLLSGQRGAFASAVEHLVLPTIVLATIPLAFIARQTRSAMLETQEEDYVRTARSKGLAPRRVMGLHALRGAFVPVVTAIGLQVSVLLGGAVLTETIFTRNGIGKWLAESLLDVDYPVVQAGILVVAGMVMTVNLFTDVLCRVVDPRMREES